MGIGNILVLCWSHKLLKEIAYNRYLRSGVDAYSRFSRLAEYFSGHLAQMVAGEHSRNSTPHCEDGMCTYDQWLYP